MQSTVDQIIGKLETMRLLATRSQEFSWFHRIQTPQLAAWACNSSLAIMKDFYGRVPKGGGPLGIINGLLAQHVEIK